MAGKPAQISLRSLEELGKSMEADPALTWARPVIAQRDGTVFCGNQRFKATRARGWQTIPTILADIDPERAKAWALKDNNVWGEWDEPVLAELLAELAGSGMELPEHVFASSEIDRLLTGLQAAVDPDDVPDPPSGPPETLPGEVVELGRHRLVCGDCRDPDTIAHLMGDDRAQLLLTDPPYGVTYEVKVSRADFRRQIAHEDAQTEPSAPPGERPPRSPTAPNCSGRADRDDSRGISSNPHCQASNAARAAGSSRSRRRGA